LGLSVLLKQSLTFLCCVLYPSNVLLPLSNIVAVARSCLGSQSAVLEILGLSHVDARLLNCYYLLFNATGLGCRVGDSYKIGVWSIYFLLHWVVLSTVYHFYVLNKFITYVKKNTQDRFKFYHHEK
jgi:hypothetical protein